MTVFVALLRAVNVGGTGKLPMRDLVAMCEQAGYRNVRTYIASGNAVFTSCDRESAVKAKLEKALQAYAGKPVGVLVRTTDELAAVLAGNPFRDAPPNKVVAIFLDKAPEPGAADAATGRKNEVVRPGTREIYVHYPDGLGRSKLKISAAAQGTARNMNTIAKLVAMAASV